MVSASFHVPGGPCLAVSRQGPSDGSVKEVLACDARERQTNMAYISPAMRGIPSVAVRAVTVNAEYSISTQTIADMIVPA